MSELTLGARVRAVARITNGYGEGQRVVAPGCTGTVCSFSRARSYPLVEWDAGWTDICRPEQVQPLEAVRPLDTPLRITWEDFERAVLERVQAGMYESIEEVLRACLEGLTREEENREMRSGGTM